MVVWTAGIRIPLNERNCNVRLKFHSPFISYRRLKSYRRLARFIYYYRTHLIPPLSLAIVAILLAVHTYLD